MKKICILHTHLLCVNGPKIILANIIMGKTVEVWCKNLCAGFNPFVPIKKIKSSVIIAFDCLEEDRILIVIPVVHNVM